MRHMGLLEGKDKLAEFRQREPVRQLPAQYACPAADIARALPGDDEHILRAARLRTAQKGEQRRMRFGLRSAVKIEARIDRIGAACKPLTRAAVERRETRRGLRRRLGDDRNRRRTDG